jgi:[ribosomal protein S5]-alanine N-acetyltransferase
LQRAAGEPDVRTVRATISPDNAASLATIAGFGFTENGEQWDEEDGRELIFDRLARPA